MTKEPTRTSLWKIKLALAGNLLLDAVLALLLLSQIARNTAFGDVFVALFTIIGALLGYYVVSDVQSYMRVRKATLLADRVESRLAKIETEEGGD